jgi:predicted negative regulator of RcsB-dependent stress response
MVKDKDKKTLDAEITNALLDDFDKFEHFASTYWKQIALTAVGIVVAVAVFFSIKAMRDNAMKNANDALADAKTETELIATLKKYPDYKASNFARLRLARIYLGEKKFDKAFEQFKKLVASDIPEEMRWRIRLDEGYALELQGKFKEAAAKLAAMGRESFLPEAFRCEANYSAGRIYAQQNDLKNAEKCLAKAKNAKMSKKSMAGDAAVEFWQRQAKFMLNMIKSGEFKANSSVKAAPKK